MEGSIEMKMQSLDKILDTREQMNTMLSNLGFYHCCSGESSSVLVRNTDEFFEYANHINAEVMSDYKKDADGDIKVKFIYRDVEFSTFLNPDKISLYGHRIHRSDENVL
ncbi:MAG: hypothetical protein ACI4DK_12775 [Lachnospiraceae bacterium]